MKNILIIVVGLLLVGVVVGLFLFGSKSSVENPDTEPTPVTQNETPTVPETTPPPTEEPETVNEPVEEIGSSYGELPIRAYHFGDGAKEVLFIGGMHGGYSWNTSVVAYALIDYLNANPGAVPRDVKVTVIPVLNPDGLMKIAGKTEAVTKADIPTGANATILGRFNGNNVDLNRNFDCDWKASGTWQSRTVSGGTKAFSEPESQALRDYVNANTPTAVVVWYSAAGGVYSSNCYNGVLPETKKLTNLYAQASGYPAYETFDYYEITGDAVNWLAKMNIPAISVLLTTHEDAEWEKNKRGIEALLKHYGE